MKVNDKNYTAIEFVTRFDLKMQSKILEKGLKLIDCNDLNVPNLKKIASSFGSESLFSWLNLFLIDLNNFIGVKTKMTTEQLEYLSKLISCEYWFLNIAEINLFFIKVKTGVYGKFYGVVDAQLIMTFLNDFNNQRIIEINKHNFEIKKQEEKEKWEKWEKESITFEEYKNRCKCLIFILEYCLNIK